MMRSNAFLPPIYPIIDNSISPSNKIKEIAQDMVAGGARIIQFRAKGLFSKEFLESALIIRRITKDSGVVFIVNDRVDVALLADADGVHLGQDDLPVKEARKLLGANKIIGYSTHNMREALEAKKLPIDYISFGPIFPTKTKPDAQTPKGLKGLAEARKAVDMPIVAIGGITEANMRHAFMEGVDSVAMISDILTSADICKKVKKLIIAQIQQSKQ